MRRLTDIDILLLIKIPVFILLKFYFSFVSAALVSVQFLIKVHKQILFQLQFDQLPLISVYTICCLHLEYCQSTKLCKCAMPTWQAGRLEYSWT
jgi:hypothetical protein